MNVMQQLNYFTDYFLSVYILHSSVRRRPVAVSHRFETGSFVITDLTTTVSRAIRCQDWKDNFSVVECTLQASQALP